MTFHSLEDAIVKRFLRARAGREAGASRHLPPQSSKMASKMGTPSALDPSFRFVNPKPVSPSGEELAANPRARSARLRWAVRTEAPAWGADAAPTVPRL